MPDYVKYIEKSKILWDELSDEWNAKMGGLLIG